MKYEPLPDGYLEGLSGPGPSVDNEEALRTMEAKAAGKAAERKLKDERCRRFAAMCLAESKAAYDKRKAEGPVDLHTRMARLLREAEHGTEDMCFSCGAGLSYEDHDIYCELDELLEEAGR